MTRREEQDDTSPDRSYGDAPEFPEKAPDDSGVSDGADLGVDRSYGDAPSFPAQAPNEPSEGASDERSPS